MNEDFTCESVEEIAMFLGDEEIEIKEVNKAIKRKTKGIHEL